MPCLLTSNHYGRDLSCNLCFLVILYFVNKADGPNPKPSHFAPEFYFPIQNSRSLFPSFLINYYTRKVQNFPTLFYTPPNKVKLKSPPRGERINKQKKTQQIQSNSNYHSWPPLCFTLSFSSSSFTTPSSPQPIFSTRKASLEKS